MVGTIEALAAVVVALCAVVSLVIAARNRSTLNTIHVLVNSKMTEALAEVHDLKGALERAKHSPAEE